MGRAVSIIFIFTITFGAVPHHLEKGDLLKSFERFISGEADTYDLYLLKSIMEDQKIEPPEYFRLFAKGLLFEKRGEIEKALENYLHSIEIHSGYNPSYFRLNALLRKVRDPEKFRKRLTSIVRKRFEKPPPVILENAEGKYVFLVEKMSQYLLVYKGKELEDLYPVTTGKDWEDKWREGDRRTPEGIYYFTEFIPPERLPSIYGGIAVALNYPNPVDRLLGKGGSGIWLHGSDRDRNKIPFSTRGCVVAGNGDLRKIVKRISKRNTLIAIYKEIPTDLKVDDINKFLEDWRKSWESKDIERFLTFYSDKFSWKGGGIREWRRYKKRVISNKKFIEIRIEDLTIIAFRRGLSRDVEYYVAEFRQVYRSDRFSDRGIKRLYIIKEQGDLKILKEEFIREGR